MTEREIGAETRPCPNCGAQLKASTQPDGSVAYETCPSCYGGGVQEQPKVHAPQRASEQTVVRERGTRVSDTTTSEE